MLLINTISRVQAKLESIVEKDDGVQIMAVKAYRSHSRAYTVSTSEREQEDISRSSTSFWTSCQDVRSERTTLKIRRCVGET